MRTRHRLTSFPATARRALSAIAFAAASLLVGSAAMACPDRQQTGQQIRYSSDQLWSPQTLSVIAGGGDNLQNCPQPGVGYVATRPDFDFAFTDNSAGRDLEFRVNASCDTVLLVNDARGEWHFNDDGSNGLNASLRIPNAPAGGYDIWVGTYGPSTCQATLTLETFGGGNVTPPSGLTALPTSGNLTEFRNRTGQTFGFQITGASGGSVWGSDVYTDDSQVARAAVHAGVLQVGQTGVVQVTILPGQQSYQGTNRNGVQTSNYGSWSGSYSFGGQGASVQPGVAPAAAGQWQINANNYQGTLTLVWTGSGWTGTVNFAVYGREEVLESIRFDPASGQVEFTRPIPGAIQNYRGILANGQMSGQFNQAGGGYDYNWSAGQVAQQPGGAPGSPNPMGGAQGK